MRITERCPGFLKLHALKSDHELESDCNYIERMTRSNTRGWERILSTLLLLPAMIGWCEEQHGGEQLKLQRDEGESEFLGELNNVTLEMAVGINGSSRESSKRMIIQSSMEQMKNSVDAVAAACHDRVVGGDTESAYEASRR